MTKNNMLSSDGYLSYVGILTLARKDRQTYYINPSMLSHLLTDIYPSPRCLYDSLSNGINELIKEKIITKVKSDKINEWTIDISNLANNNPSKNYYTTVNEQNVQAILNSNKTHYGTSISLLRFYIYLLSTIHKKGSSKEGVGFTSFNYMSETMDINPKTVSSYIKKLEKLKLIYVYRPKNTIVFNSGEVREIVSTYGEYSNKEKIIKLGQEYENNYGSGIENQFKRVKRVSMDKTRGHSQRYNNICRCLNEDKEIKYSYEECKDIYATMVKLNSKYDEECRYERIKDLTVFGGFDFYNTE